MPLEHDSDSSLAQAVRAAGSQSAFGRLLGLRQSTIHEWLKNSRPLPAEHVFAIEAATGISRHELRPDIYPIETTPSPASNLGDTSAAEVSPRPAAGEYIAHEGFRS